MWLRDVRASSVLARRPIGLWAVPWFCLVVMVAACAPPVAMVVAPDGARGCRADSHGAAITWIRPAPPDHQRALDARCVGVGPPLLLAASDRVVADARHVTVVTWNLHDGRGDLRRLLRGLHHATGSTTAPDATILLLQEAVRGRGPASAHHRADVSDESSAPDIVDMARELDWHLAYVPVRVRGRAPEGADAADRGTAILSSLPLGRPTAIELPVERQRRVALAATVRAPLAGGRTLSARLVNVHLENRSGARRLWVRSGAARTHQTEALLAALAIDPGASGALAPDDTSATLLGGDFNTWLGPFEGTLRLLRAAHPAWTQEDARPTARPHLRLDHLFARLPPGVRVTHRRLDDRYGSDHHPVVVALDFGAS